MTIWLLSAFAVLGLTLLTAAPSPAGAAEPPPEWDGLTRVPAKGADHLYMLRGADLGIYTKVAVAPVQVSFDPKWNPNAHTRNPQRFMSSTDMDKLRSDLADEFHMIFESELMNGGYMLTTQSGDDVLSITPAIMNLSITAPKQETAGRGRHYVANTGHMTLVLEMRDSESGQLLGRVVDTHLGRLGGRFVLAGPVNTLADARAALTNWSRATLGALNYAKQNSRDTAVAEKTERNDAKPR